MKLLFLKQNISSFLFGLPSDINECEIFGTCPQVCKNSKGSYECFCAEGFRSVGDQQGTQCAANGNYSY